MDPNNSMVIEVNPRRLVKHQQKVCAYCREKGMQLQNKHSI